MSVARKIIEIDEVLCDGCGKCAPSCAEGAIQIIHGKAKLVGDRYCDGLGACLGECPKGALKVIERPADDFDEAAVREHLKTRAAAQSTAPQACLSMRLRRFAPDSGARSIDGSEASMPSALTHWPIQIRLVPPTAPFLDDADLLIAADCVPAAYPDFHRDLLAGKVLLMGCPKFDNAEQYVECFANLFASASVKSVTVAVMQVPCCQSLPLIVKAGMAAAGLDLPIEKVVVSIEGGILARGTLQG